MVRSSGALTQLPIHLAPLGLATSWTGDFQGAAAILAEADVVAAATGIPMAPFTALRLAALRGREAEATGLIERTLEVFTASGQGMGVTNAHWAAAVLYIGLARFDQALRSARATAEIAEPYVSVWVLPELVEAAVRVGDVDLARDALDRLLTATGPCDTDWSAGVAARARALVADDEAADEPLQRSHRAAGPDPAAARAGPRPSAVRRVAAPPGRRVDARAQLRAAYDLFASIGMEAFAERARRELMATGETVRKRTAEASASDELTPQEQQIALLVRDGLSNPEVGARLFLSPRTVEWHLRKVFAKLAITSRKQLRDVLPG